MDNNGAQKTNKAIAKDRSRENSQNSRGRIRLTVVEPDPNQSFKALHTRGNYSQLLSAKDLHNSRTVTTRSRQDRRNSMLFQTEVTRVDEVHDRAKPLRL
jgi:hypothetical protein